MRSKRLLGSGLLAAASLVFLILFMGLTDPIDKISFSIVFFGGLLVLLVSLGHFLVRLQTGRISVKNRSRIFIISVLLVVAVMLRSSQGLSLADAFIVFLIAFGLLFYTSRRA